MPIDCATRCSSGSSIADSPLALLAAPDLASLLPAAAPTASGSERTAPADAWEVPAGSATPTCCPPDPAISAESPFSAENRSKVSLTRGPSQGAGHGGSDGRMPAVVLLPAIAAGQRHS